MKITVLSPQSGFTPEQQKKLSQLGGVVYTNSRDEFPLEDLIKLAAGSEILGADPDNLGGFEKAMAGNLTKLLESLPNLKGVALASTSFSWIDLDYCRKRGLLVTNVPYYSTESVAEHVLGLLVCLAKKILISDRRTQQAKYVSEMGFELKGKTLGMIGLGHIGARVAELGNAIGMKVIGFSRTPKNLGFVEEKSLDEVLSQADAISINVAHNKETENLISVEQLNKMKNGVIVVNLATRELVDEKAMAEALKSGKVTSYAYEGDDLASGPLSQVETAIGLKPFAWYTKEALEKASEIWTESLVSLAQGKPVNLVA